MSRGFNQNNSMSPVSTDESVKKKQENNQPTVISAHAQYVGPIPPAEEFAKYGAVISDAPERILSVFEKDSEHVRYMQKEALKAEINTDKRGQWMSFLCVMAGFIVTGLCVWSGRDVAAVLGGLATFILAIGGIFSSNRNRNTEKNSQDS